MENQCMRRALQGICLPGTHLPDLSLRKASLALSQFLLNQRLSISTSSRIKIPAACFKERLLLR